MNDVRWSDAELRTYIAAEAAVQWFSDASDRELDRERFRKALRAQLVPVVQNRLLERAGVVTDPEGLSMVCFDLVDDLKYRHNVRRWLLVCTEPWVFLGDWSSREVEKVYKASAGRKRPSDTLLKEIERANQ